MPLSSGGAGSIGSIGGYALVDRLGSGGMGVVYLGHSASGRQVAVKVVHAQYAQDEEFRATPTRKTSLCPGSGLTPARSPGTVPLLVQGRPASRR